MYLKPRLALIARKVPKCNVLADIGTDHAYIPIFLVKEDVCEKAIASDIGEGPLNIAIKNIKDYGLENRIEIKLSDGISALYGQKADVIIISGMGGDLIVKILEEGFENIKNAKALIIQPMTAVRDVRKWLIENGFEVFDEELAMEGSRLYTVISSRWTGCCQQGDEISYIVGEKLIENKDPLLGRYINKKINQINTIITGLRKSERKNEKRIKECKNIKNELIKLF